MMTTTGFRCGTRPFTEDFRFANPMARGFASARATATRGVNEQFAGRTITVVAEALTFVAAG